MLLPSLSLERDCLFPSTLFVTHCLRPFVLIVLIAHYSIVASCSLSFWPSLLSSSLCCRFRRISTRPLTQFADLTPCKVKTQHHCRYDHHSRAKPACSALQSIRSSALHIESSVTVYCSGRLTGPPGRSHSLQSTKSLFASYYLHQPSLHRILESRGVDRGYDTFPVSSICHTRHHLHPDFPTYLAATPDEFVESVPLTVGHSIDLRPKTCRRPSNSLPTLSSPCLLWIFEEMAS